MLRRISAFLVVILMLPGTALAAGALCVVTPQVAALTDERGRELLSGPDIEDVFVVRPDALYAAGRPGAYGLYDAAGTRQGEITFEMIDDAGDPLVFRKDGLYGAMDAAGQLLVEPVWTQLCWDGEGGWLALEGDPQSEQPQALIHLDAGGETRETGVRVLGGLSPVQCGRMPYMTAYGLWGAVNPRGEVAVEAVWTSMGPFRDGYARVWGPRGAGMIDVDGRAVIEPVYRWLERGAGCVAALDDKGAAVFSADGGKRRFAIRGKNLEIGFAGAALWVSDNIGTRLYSADGAVIDEGPAGSTYASGSLGQTIACCGAWGEKCQQLISANGAAVSARLQQILPLCDGRYAWLEMDGIEYYSAELGRVQKSWDYSNMRYGLMDASGRPLTPAVYREIRPLSARRLLLLTEEETVLADINGRALRTWADPPAASGEAGG